MSLSAEPTSVYRYFDRHGYLIYVGITSRGIARNVEHNHSKEWWRFVVKQEVDHFPDRRTALRHEKTLIQQHEPPFNKQHNPHHEQLRLAYLDLQDTSKTFPSPGAIVVRFRGRAPLELVSREGDRVVFRTLGRHVKLAHLLRRAQKGQVIAGSYRKHAGVLKRWWHDEPYVYVELQGKYVHEATAAYAFVQREDSFYRIKRVMLVTPSSPPEAFGAVDPSLDEMADV